MIWLHSEISRDACARVASERGSNFEAQRVEYGRLKRCRQLPRRTFRASLCRAWSGTFNVQRYVQRPQ